MPKLHSARFTVRILLGCLLVAWGQPAGAAPEPRMRQGEQALQEFERALGANPYIVGAWHDAGWMFVQDYATSLGWACWDAARSSAPNAPAMKDVTNLEVDLRSKHPEFF